MVHNMQINANLDCQNIIQIKNTFGVSIRRTIGWFMATDMRLLPIRVTCQTLQQTATSLFTYIC